MIWYLPVRWDMMSRLPVEAYTLSDAMEKAKEIVNATARPEDVVDEEFMEMIDGSFEVDFWESNLELIRKEYNEGNPDIDIESFPELAEYSDYERNMGECTERDPRSKEIYQIMFEAGDAMFVCNIWLLPEHKYENYARGVFAAAHPNISFGMVKEAGWIDDISWEDKS